MILESHCRTTTKKRTMKNNTFYVKISFILGGDLQKKKKKNTPINPIGFCFS